MPAVGHSPTRISSSILRKAIGRTCEVRETSLALSSGHTLAWCHGAPGIALVRLRAMELVPDLAAELRPSIAIALRGTRDARN